MKNQSIRKITEGSLMVAIVAVFLLVSRMLGGYLENAWNFLIPIPLIIYSYRYDFKGSIIVFVSSCLISFLASSNPLTAAVIICPSLLVGLFFPLFKKYKIKFFGQILSLTVVFSIINFLVMVVFAKVFGYSYSEEVKMLVTEIGKIFNNNEVDLKRFENLALLFLPSLIVVMSVIESLLLYLASNYLGVKLKVIEKTNLFSFMVIEFIPSFFGIIYPLFFILLTYIVGSYGTEGNKLPYLVNVIGLNVSIIYTFFMIFQGIYFLSKYSKVKNRPFLYLLGIISLFIFPYIMIALGTLQNIMHLTWKLNQEGNITYGGRK